MLLYIITKNYVFIAKAENFNWFKLFMDDKLSDWEIKKVRDYLKSIKKDLERVNEMLKQLNDGVMSKKRYCSLW